MLLTTTTQSSFWGISFEQWKVILIIVSVLIVLLIIARLAYCLYMRNKYEPGTGEQKVFEFSVKSLKPHPEVLAHCIKEIPGCIHARIIDTKYEPPVDGKIQVYYTIEYYVKKVKP